MFQSLYDKIAITFGLEWMDGEGLLESLIIIHIRIMKCNYFVYIPGCLESAVREHVLRAFVKGSAMTAWQSPDLKTLLDVFINFYKTSQNSS